MQPLLCNPGQLVIGSSASTVLLRLLTSGVCRRRCSCRSCLLPPPLQHARHLMQRRIDPLVGPKPFAGNVLDALDHRAAAMDAALIHTASVWQRREEQQRVSLACAHSKALLSAVCWQSHVHGMQCWAVLLAGSVAARLPCSAAHPPLSCAVSSGVLADVLSGKTVSPPATQQGYSHSCKCVGTCLCMW